MKKYAQARYWMLTIPHHEFVPHLPQGVAYIKGQLECGASDYLHWQLFVYFESKIRLTGVTDVFGKFHAEPSKSKSAEEYVWKDDTAVPGTRFELGKRPFKRQCKSDWDQVWKLAKEGKFEDIDKSILIPHYSAISRIATDHITPVAVEKHVEIYWGDSGTGKSRKAWEEAGMDAYPKNARTKFWCGYRGQKNVVCDEFNGSIDIGNFLVWCDRYPIIVEVKGGARAFTVEKLWFTSNIDPMHWWADATSEQLAGVRRRCNITHFTRGISK